MKKVCKRITESSLTWALTLVMVSALTVLSVGQYRKSQIDPPPSPAETTYLDNTRIPDSIQMPSPVQTILPQEYADYVGREYAADLRDPSNITSEVEYDPATGMFYLHTKLGGKDIITPYMMTPEEYNEVMTRKELFGYFQDRNAEIFENKDKQAFNIFDMNFSLGPLEKVFGPGGVRLTTQGSI